MDMRPFWQSATKVVLIAFAILLIAATLFQIEVSQTASSVITMVFAFYFGQNKRTLINNKENTGLEKPTK